jgi:hypothetical protein
MMYKISVRRRFEGWRFEHRVISPLMIFPPTVQSGFAGILGISAIAIISSPNSDMFTMWSSSRSLTLSPQPPGSVNLNFASWSDPPEARLYGVSATSDPLRGIEATSGRELAQQ